jgi:preprotein translocase subunit SecA
MLLDIINSININNIKFNEFEEIFEEGKIKIQIKDLFNAIIDKVFDTIFDEYDNAEQEKINAKKIFKNADWNMETFRYMVDTEKREKPFLFYSLDNKNDKDIINKACEIICLFQLSNGNEIIDLLEYLYNQYPDKWEEIWILELNNLASRKIKETKREVQTVESYLKDIFYCNEKKEKGKSYIEKENINKNRNLREYLILSEKNYNQFLEKINNWDRIQCIDWINDNKDLFNSNKKDFIPSVFAVFSVLNKNIGLYILKRIQLLSLLLLTSNYPNGGVFCEIGTGEGKSTIVEFLAAFLGLSGATVDIISSSPILAERDAKDKYKIEFFECLGLTVGYSSNQNDKFRYEKTILYGDVLTNEGDILRDVYEKENIRKGRKFHFIIIDEVDNLSLDNLSSKTQLVSSFPGKDYFYPFYHCILITFPKLEQEYANKENKVEIVKQKLLKAIFDLYNKEKEKPEAEREIFYPDYLKEEIETLIPCWIESAITIYYFMKENKDYIINEKGEINPVDYSNTGIVQRNMVWENGMHQMLQILNALSIHPESTGTNYLSNVSYFKKYFKNNKSNIFGVTGTIGEISSQKILMDIYKVDIYFIPRAIKKQLRIYGAIISDNKEQWLNEIKNDAIRETRNGRAVLIICKSIGITEEIFKLFKENNKEKSITSIVLYNKNEEEENNKNKKRKLDDQDSGKRERIVTSVEFELFSGTIIISTNLAGRGTDIKLNQNIVENGGLHVIITFLPENKRIEDQNYGRAARNGQPGTGRLILNKKEEGFEEDDIREVKKIRAQNEYDLITKSMKTEVPKYIFEDLLFDDFSTSLDDIVDINNSYEDLFKDNCNKSIKERSIRVKKIQKNYGAHLLEKFKILILAKMKIFKNLKKRR